jgi:solute carrier family 35 protein E3
MPIARHVFLLPSCKQIAKLLIIPFVCLVELFWMGRRFTTPVVCSILLVILGVAVV